MVGLLKRGCAALLLALCFIAPAKADPVMDRINATQTIRCGYVNYSPASYRDMKTGKLVGYNVELVEEAARRMGLKVDWAYESNWPTIVTDFQTKKFDVLCVTYWGNPRTAKFLLGSEPVFYQPVFFAVREGDTRFDKDISKVNSPDVSISFLEGDVPEDVVKELYPNAKRIAIAPTGSFSQNFAEVASKRADVTITSAPDMAEFQKNNPGKLKIITNQPVRIYGCLILTPPDAVVLKGALDLTIREMQLDGTVTKIMKKYTETPDDYYMVDHPYTKAVAHK